MYKNVQYTLYIIKYIILYYIIYEYIMHSVLLQIINLYCGIFRILSVYSENKISFYKQTVFEEILHTFRNKKSHSQVNVLNVL